jgi:trehalose 6-phosphate phosphatase
MKLYRWRCSPAFSFSMTQTKEHIPHLFQCWEQISKRIRAVENIRLFLDFDGTLVSICPTPDDVKLHEKVRRVLGRLNRHPRVHVALLSGRRNAALRKYVHVPRIQLLGLYGWERDGGMVMPARTRKAVSRLRSILRSLPTEFPGVRLEDKGLSFGIHFRGASPLATRRAQIWARKLLIRIRADFTVIHGKLVWEIVPRQVKGKGLAVREFMKQLQPPFLPFYLGDDVTDEPVFKALRRGITIRVGPVLPTNAHFRLRDPGEVRIFLERLEKELR